MRADVREYVAKCDKCQRHNPLRKGTGELHPVAFPDRAFAMWAMDLVGPLPETPDGFKYLMVITDYATRFISYSLLYKISFNELEFIPYFFIRPPLIKIYLNIVPFLMKR